MNRASSLALALCAATAAHANTPADYAYVFPIEMPPAGSSSAWRIDLTPAVYAWTQDAALGDVEVFNADGQAVPLARLTPAPAAARIRAAAVPLLALPASVATRKTGTDLRLIVERDAVGRLHRIEAGEHAPAGASAARDWLLDASAIEHPLDTLELNWRAPAAGVVARFRVEGSDDLENWREVGHGSVLMLDQDGAHLERHDIALNGVRARYLCLRRLDDGADLLGLAARARWNDGNETPTRTWLTADMTVAPGVADVPPPAPGVTRYAYVLPAALPLDAARIELAGDNALASLTLSARTPAQPHAIWKELARVTAFHLRTQGEPLRNGDIEWANTARLRDLRIESATPLSAPPRLSVAMRADAFVFLAEGRAPFTLAAGSARAKHGDYPLDAALAGLRAEFGKDWQPPQATLGNAQSSAGAAALQPIIPPLPWRRWMLWAVLVAGAAVVGGFAISLLRGSRPHD